jgi:hypothetical protein
MGYRLAAWPVPVIMLHRTPGRALMRLCPEGEAPWRVFLVSDCEKGMSDRQMTNRNEQPKESGIDQTQNRRTNSK